MFDVRCSPFPSQKPPRPSATFASLRFTELRRRPDFHPALEPFPQLLKSMQPTPRFEELDYRQTELGELTLVLREKRERAC